MLKTLLRAEHCPMDVSGSLSFSLHTNMLSLGRNYYYLYLLDERSKAQIVSKRHGQQMAEQSFEDNSAIPLQILYTLYYLCKEKKCNLISLVIKDLSTETWEWKEKINIRCQIKEKKGRVENGVHKNFNFACNFIIHQYI